MSSTLGFTVFSLSKFSYKNPPAVGRGGGGWNSQEGEGHLDTLLCSLVLSQLGQASIRPMLAASPRSSRTSELLSASEEEDFYTMFRLHNKIELHEEKWRIQR